MFQLVDELLAMPGQCYLCGSPDKAPYIDWGVSIEFYGALYTCHECTGAVASLLGWVSAEKHHDIVMMNDKLAAENIDLLFQTRALRQAIEGLRAAGFVVEENEPISGDDIQSDSVIADLDTDFLVDTSSVDEATRDSDELLDSGEGTSDESSNDKGMDKLRSDDSGFKFSL
jgi:hypothetical protein